MDDRSKGLAKGHGEKGSISQRENRRGFPHREVSTIGHEKSLYIDLERPKDFNKVQDPEAFFSINADKLICLDEIQRLPEIFPHMRSIIDDKNRNGQFLILGSASPDLIKQSSESLAGRITYLELTPFLFNEITQKNKTQEFDFITGLKVHEHAKLTTILGYASSNLLTEGKFLARLELRIAI